MDTEINFLASSRIRQSTPNVATETQPRYETVHEDGKKKNRKNILVTRRPPKSESLIRWGRFTGRITERNGVSREKPEDDSAEGRRWKKESDALS